MVGLLAIGGLSAPVFADEFDKRLLPVDDTYRDATLQEFLDRLRQVVKFREHESLVPFIAPKIVNNKGVPDGAQAFANYWRMDSQDSELWTELSRILSLGGTFLRSNRGVTFCGPYIFTEFPDNLDIFGHGVVIEENVLLKSEPDFGSRTLRTLSYHLVQVKDWRSKADSSGGAWVKVTVLDKGETGYLPKDKIRSPSDYHMCVSQFDKGWLIISLSTGS